MSQAITRELFDQVMVPNYNPQQFIPVRGHLCRVWDQSDNEYIDFAGGIAVSALGHTHPVLVSALKEQAEKLWHLSNTCTNEPALRLALQLCQLSFAEKVYFCNSGAEANEAAFKLARKYAYDHFGEEKHEIIAFEQAFHGRTLFTVSVGGQAKYRKGFEPVPAGITHVPYNDLSALEKAISDKTCAVVAEPIQGEGGIIPAQPGFLEGIRKLCNQHNALMVLDEIQTGVARTGKFYAYMHSSIEPDILTTAKSLGGGFPVGAMLTTDKCAQSFGFGTHGSTYGGNPLACAVANALLDEINSDEIYQGVKKKSQLFFEALNHINQKHQIFSEIRGQGLLIGAELIPEWHGKAAKFLAKAREHGLMLLVAGPNVLRFAPALIIPEPDIEQGMQRLEQAIAALVAAGPDNS